MTEAEVSDWRGSQVVNLGAHRWGLTDMAEQEVVIACPGKTGQTRRISPIGIIEIPLGCEARTREWIFPSSQEAERVWTQRFLR